MKKLKTVILLLSIIHCNNVFSQSNILGNDTSNVYLAVLKNIDLTEQKAFVLKETNIKDIKKFKFNHIENYLLSNKGFELYKDSSWNRFLLSVDTSRITNHKIYIAPIPDNIKFIKDSETDFSKMLVDPINIYGIIYFSPILLSSDKKKAFVISKKLRPSSGLSKSAIFLAKNNGIWEIEKTILLEIE